MSTEPEQTPAPGPKPWVPSDTIARLRALGGPDLFSVRNTVCKLQCQCEGCAGAIFAEGHAVLLGTHGDRCQACEAGTGPVPSAALIAWQTACPTRFRSGDTRTRIDHPEFNARAYAEAKAALPATGNLTANLILVGDTGASKSRMAWLIAYELMVRRGIRAVCLTGTEFRERIGKEYRDGDPEAFMRTLKDAPLLLWDDFGQDVLRSGTLSDLRGVIDYRYNNVLPTFITTNFPESVLTRRLIENATGDSLAGAAAASITRRLFEDAKVVKVVAAA